MLDIRYIRENPDKVMQGLQKRGIRDVVPIVTNILSLDKERRNMQVSVDRMASEINQLSKHLNVLIKIDQQKLSDIPHKGPLVDREEIELYKVKLSELKIKYKELSTHLNSYEASLQEALYELPNLPYHLVPVGLDAEDNIILYQTGSISPTAEQRLPHWELCQQYDIVNFKLGNKITGAGFPVYKGGGAALQRALINFFLDEARQIGYEEIQPPIVVCKESALSTGQLPDKEGKMYQLVGEPFYLIPTAEVPITNIYRDCIIDARKLPIKHVGYTPCFRKETGSWGSHVRGLNRLHQFDKVELVQICHPYFSYDTLQNMIQYVAQLVEKLMLPYRIVKVCSGDIGFTAAMTYDIEVFSIVQQKWLEVSSVSNFETYQSHRLNLRYKDHNKKNKYLHTLNGSALALPRIVASLLEYYQTSTGITIPSVLRRYTGFDRIQ